VLPDLYEIGMSPLGFRILYHMINEIEGMVCERVFAPDQDLEQLLRQKGAPLWSLETCRPLKSFDCVGFSLNYELCYTSILTVLDLSGIPLKAAERSEDDPIVLGGGSSCYNPAPTAEFFDVYLLGEGEEALPELLNLLAGCKEEGLDRESTLLKLAGIEGAYVPRFYEETYDDEGRFIEHRALREDVPANVRKRFLKEMDSAYYPDRVLAPNVASVHERLTLELFRGCAKGCRFCQAGYVYRPVRSKDQEVVFDQYRRLMETSPSSEVGLLSLNSPDYKPIPELIDRIREDQADNPSLKIGIPSSRVDDYTLELALKVKTPRTRGITMAVESASEGMRERIGKPVTDEQIIRAARDAYLSGLTELKMYFMVGLPGETDEDLDRAFKLLGDLSRILRDLRREKGMKRGMTVKVSVGGFVPKAHTPFQWAAMLDGEELERRLRCMSRLRKIPGVQVSYHEPDSSLLEALMSRGDRRVAKAILAAWQKGARFDSWREHFDFEIWLDAMKEAGLEFAGYLGARPTDAELPWDFIWAGAKREMLLDEWSEAMGKEA